MFQVQNFHDSKVAIDKDENLAILDIALHY